MYRLDDYECQNTSCSEQGKSIELFLDANDTPLCSECNNVLNRLIPCPKGYVRGTKNPVRYAKG